MSVFETMMRGAKKLAGNPGAALKRMKGNAAGQADRMGKGVAKGANATGMALTRGAGLKPARDLGKLMKEVKSKVTK